MIATDERVKQEKALIIKQFGCCSKKIHYQLSGSLMVEQKKRVEMFMETSFFLNFEARSEWKG